VVGFCDDDVPGETAFCTANNVKEPLASWNPAPGITWAPNDLIWYTHPSIPEFQNSFLVTFLKTEKVRRIQINAAGDAITAQDDFFVSQWGRLRDITAGPDGSIYLATNVNPYRIIKIRATGVTPVLISNFKVNCNDQASLISWTTESEINNKHFLLYKSSDGINYDLVSTIASLAPAGNSAIKISYSYADNGKRSTNNLYKLVSEDRDGRKKDWGIITSNCGVDVNRFTLLPNPVKGQSKLMISGAADLLTINVHNSVGQPVYQKRSSGTVVLPSDKWQPGVYSITVMNNKQEVVYRNKLLVQ
jgi:hypothetical protein